MCVLEFVRHPRCRARPAWHPQISICFACATVWQRSRGLQALTSCSLPTLRESGNARVGTKAIRLSDALRSNHHGPDPWTLRPKRRRHLPGGRRYHQACLRQPIILGYTTTGRRAVKKLVESEDGNGICDGGLVYSSGSWIHHQCFMTPRGHEFGALYR